MAVDVNRAYAQAALLDEEVHRLQSAKADLLQYRDYINQNWIAHEVAYYRVAIARTCEKYDAASEKLRVLAESIRSTARQVQREEEEARARALKQQKINNAQSNLDAANKRLSSLTGEYVTLMKQYDAANKKEKKSLLPRVRELEADIKEAENACEECYRALQRAKR